MLLMILCYFLFSSFQAQCILAIAEYVKKNPKASQEEVAKEVGKHIQEFATKIDNM